MFDSGDLVALTYERYRMLRYIGQIYTRARQILRTRRVEKESQSATRIATFDARRFVDTRGGEISTEKDRDDVSARTKAATTAA